MRSALELHKEVIQGLQTVDAFTQDMFLPQEIDFHLNKQQDSYINELLDKGFADRQLKLDYIQDLIVKNKSLPVFFSPTAFFYESGAINSFLPGDYKHLLDTRVNVKSGENCAKVIESVEKTNIYFSFLKLITTKETPDYFSKVQLIRVEANQEETVLATAEFPVPEVDDTYLTVRNLVYQANKKLNTTEVYWEKYSDYERQGNIIPNSFIIVSRDNTVSYKLKVDEEEVLSTVETQEIEIYTEDSIKDLIENGYTSTVLLENKEIYERKQNVLYVPKIKEPHTNLSDGILFNYYSSNFIIDKVQIDYIRDPQPISLESDQSCEMSIAASHIIANRTIEYLKLAIENPIYKENLQYNEIRNQD